MKLLKLEIEPLSSFGTYPKGDSFFGFFLYWLSRLGYSIEKLKEKIVFSDMMPRGYFYKPTLPLNCFLDINDDNFNQKRKKTKSIKWIREEDLLNGNIKAIIEYEKQNFFKEKVDVKVHLNKLTNKTQKELFTPFSQKEIEFLTPLWMFVYTDFEEKKLTEILNYIGKFGFGANSSLGKGKFRVNKIEEYKINRNGNFGLALSPLWTKKCGYYEVFTRFGKFYSTSKYLKKYVVLKDSGALIKNANLIEGKILENGINNKSFIQAKSIMIPFEVDCIKGCNED